MGVTSGFQKATLFADVTPRAMLAAVRDLRERFLPMLRQELCSRQ